jgi:hypothetical protein
MSRESMETTKDAQNKKRQKKKKKHPAEANKDSQ